MAFSNSLPLIASTKVLRLEDEAEGRVRYL